MSRLQVGGLALIIKGRKNDLNIGKTVELVRYYGSDFNGISEWYVGCSDLLHTDSGFMEFGLIESDRLIPLGDKQTQDELRKECLENV